MRRLALRAFALLLLLPPLAPGAAAPRHEEGFLRYARVDRGSGEWREMLVDAGALPALRDGRAIPDGTTILMESVSAQGDLGSIFAKRWDGERWRYGSFRPGGTLADFLPRSQCVGCHEAAAEGGTFTRPLLAAFAASGAVQRRFCDAPGRRPCPDGTYASPPVPPR
jgi:hypothetical protein